VKRRGEGPTATMATMTDKSNVFRRGRGGATPLRPPLPLGFWVGLGDNDNIDDNPTPSAGHTIHTQQSNRVKER
jgi:hypothetical protein